MKEEKKYEQWVDIIKGISIIQVVFLHINYTYNVPSWLNIHSLLGNSWHMPVFMIVAGFFLSLDKLSKPWSFIAHKFKYLYVRLLWFYIPILLLHNYFLTCGLYSPAGDYGGKIMTEFSPLEYLQKILEVIFFMGREPYATPLWFVYVLFLAFVVMSSIMYVIGKTTENNVVKRQLVLGIVLFILSSVSLVLTNSFGFTIPRISNTFTSMWLIYLGFLINNTYKVRYDSKILLISSTMVLFVILLFCDEMCLMTNNYRNIFQLTAVGITAVYILGYLAKHIEYTLFGNILAYIGNRSFTIMSLHLLSFSIASILLNNCLDMDLPIFRLGSRADNAIVFVVLILCGVGFPLFADFLLHIIGRTTQDIKKAKKKNE